LAAGVVESDWLAEVLPVLVDDPVLAVLELVLVPLLVRDDVADDPAVVLSSLLWWNSTAYKLTMAKARAASNKIRRRQ
jgi:hypothetical protein